MNIQYVSDLHLEYHSSATFDVTSIQQAGEVLVLAGNIGDPFSNTYEALLEHVSAMWDKVFLVAGNHEYYGYSVVEVLIGLRRLVGRFGNITFLENAIEDFRGVRFAGTTLWTHIDDRNGLTDDLTCIQYMSVDLISKMHARAIEFIEKTVLTSTIPVVMITHHVPSSALVTRGAGLCSIGAPIVCWIYGHTHQSLRQAYQGVEMCCNAVGYPGENKSFSLDSVVDV